MRFRKITYENYRCFLNGTIKFKEVKEKNINVLIGPNGGGKTETLFSFWWALYDFDFSSLRAKDSTPYALNSAMYRELEGAAPGTVKTCSVAIEFENEGEIYLIKKNCEYKKSEKRITKLEYQEFSKFNEKKELSIPERDPDKIAIQLNRIIPKSILYGIIFDGERMQKLSISNDSSKNAIKGVISDITNVELIEKCSEYFGSIKRMLTKDLRKSASKIAGSDLEEIINELSEKENKLIVKKRELDESKNLLDEYSVRCKEISEELRNSEVVKDIENKRNRERVLLEAHEKNLNELYKQFSASLKDAYLLVSEKLLDDVDSIIKKYDVPEDLTVPAVKNILKRERCICGCVLDEEARSTLKLLIESLPPDNINSTLAEIIRQRRNNIDEIKTQTGANYNLIAEREKDIKDTKENIASYSKQINELTDGQTDEDIQYIKDLEKENEYKREKIGFFKSSIPFIEDEFEKTKKEIEDLKNKRDSYSKNMESTQSVNTQIAFIEKCKNALEKIKEINKNSALSEINQRIDQAFKLLSEDADLGRRLRIVQYDDRKMYNMVVYLESKCKDVINNWRNDGQFDKMKNDGFTEEEIIEKAILQCVDSNSTGQSKMNTLAFVKAILDYSNYNKGEDGVEINKEYPLLIDSPFGDISGDNLVKSSSYLHEFTSQIILMLDKDHYESLSKYFEQYISNVYRFEKLKEENHTNIICEKEI